MRNELIGVCVESSNAATGGHVPLGVQVEQDWLCLGW